MIRTFDTHKIRNQKELTGCLWTLSTCSGDKAGNEYKVLTPFCTESHPEFSNYRGESDYTTTFTAGGNIRLEFKGVSHTATVFLDGNIIAKHYNAYTIFDAIVKDLPYDEHTEHFIRQFKSETGTTPFKYKQHDQAMTDDSTE